MGLKFFADHCVPNSVIQGLLDAGHEVIRLKDHIPIESPDPIVIATAQELDSILISLNGDFTPLEIMPRCSLRARLRPGRAHAPEGGPLGWRLQRG